MSLKSVRTNTPIYFLSGTVNVALDISFKFSAFIISNFSLIILVSEYKSPGLNT